MKTNNEIIKEVATNLGYSQKDVKSVIENFVDVITTSLVSGEDVKIKDIGTFKIKETAQRNGRNPKTGESIVIEKSKKVAFSVTSSLKQAVKES